MNDELEDVVIKELDALGFDLVELRGGRQQGRPVLEVRIDRRDGEKVTVDDCARASRALEARLDDGSWSLGRRYVLRCRRRVSSVRCGTRPSGGGSSVVSSASRLSDGGGSGRIVASKERSNRRGRRRRWRAERDRASMTRGEEARSRSACRGHGSAAGVSLEIGRGARDGRFS